MPFFPWHVIREPAGVVRDGVSLFCFAGDVGVHFHLFRYDWSFDVLARNFYVSHVAVRVGVFHVRARRFRVVVVCDEDSEPDVVEG